MSTMNKTTYKEMVKEDIGWLWEALVAFKKQHPAENRGRLEANHIEQVLRWSVEALYGQNEVLSIEKNCNTCVIDPTRCWRKWECVPDKDSPEYKHWIIRPSLKRLQENDN